MSKSAQWNQYRHCYARLTNKMQGREGASLGTRSENLPGHMIFEFAIIGREEKARLFHPMMSLGSQELWEGKMSKGRGEEMKGEEFSRISMNNVTHFEHGTH